MRGRLASCPAVLICHVFLSARLALGMGWRPMVLHCVAPRFRDSQNVAREKGYLPTMLKAGGSFGPNGAPGANGSGSKCSGHSLMKFAVASWQAL